MESHKSNAQLISNVNAKMREGRDIDIFTGICIGVLCDGHANIDEIKFIQHWLKENNNVQKHPIALRIIKKLDVYLADGVIDDNEEMDILNSLISIATGNFSNDSIFCTPPPAIQFDGNKFAFTGEFSNSRDALEEAVKLRGAKIQAKEVSRNTNYVVVGDSPSANYKHQGMGTKLERALELREMGSGIHIISEHHLANYLV